MRTTPEAIVNQIAVTLRDSYESGFPILKELVQNADDPGASWFHFGWHPPLTEAAHPLLRLPAVFFVNDGKFEAADQDAIQSIGINAKAGDDSVIGKFGLGLKSVFHLCEAFFYGVSSVDKLPEGQPATLWEIVNPWADHKDVDRFHSGWDDFSEGDQDVIKKALDTILQQCRRWCVLWIPLRKQPAQREFARSIVREFPGSDEGPPTFMEDRTVALRLAEVLPLLRSVNNMRYWRVQDVPHRLSPVYEVAMRSSASRRCYPHPALKPGQARRTISGAIDVTIENDRRPKQLLYAGVEHILDLPYLTRLRKSEYWPKTQTLLDEAEDKSVPHIACCFSGMPPTADKSHFCIKWAVFLPVGEVIESIEFDASFDCSLILHGYFFLDSGRRRIDGLSEEVENLAPASEADVQRAWNSALAQQGVLRAVLPALAQFCHAAAVRADDIEALTAALQKSHLFNQFRQHITFDHQWILQVTESGEVWTLVPSQSVVLEIPKPPDADLARPWRIFPSLRSLSGQRSLTYWSRGRPLPKLASTRGDNGWSEADLSNTLDVSADQLFRDSTCLDYVNQFLDGCAGPARDSERVQARLRDLARSAFAGISTKDLASVRERLRRFVGFVAAATRCSLRCNDTEVVRALATVPISMLLVPADFDFEQPASAGRLNAADAIKLLGSIDTLLRQAKDKEHTTSAAIESAVQILTLLETSERPQVLALAGNLQILRGTDPRNGKEVALSPNAIVELKGARRVFRFSPPPVRFGFGLELAQASPQNRILFVTKDLSDSLFGQENPLPQCDIDGCIGFLQSVPDLGLPESRKILLSRLAGGDSSAVRYLLHGQPDRYTDQEPLWAPAVGENQVWSKLAQLALASTNDQWRVVDADLADMLSRGELHHRLNVHDLTHGQIENLLRGAHVKTISPNAFSPDDRELALAEIHDLALWRSLPFHEHADGVLRGIGADCFLDSDYPIGRGLASVARLIRRSPNPRVLAKQRENIPAWSAETTIRLALAQSSPDEYCSDILDGIAGLTGPQLEPLIPVLRSAKWLRDENGKSYPPEDVLFLEGLSDEVTRIVGLSQAAYLDLSKLPDEVLSHSALPILKAHMFSAGTEALECLALILSGEEGETREYCLGFFTNSPFPLEDCLRLFGADTPDGLPGWGFVREVHRAYPNQLTTHFLPALTAHHLPPDSSVCVLNWLAKRHQGSPSVTRQQIRQVFNQFLQSAVSSTDFGRIFPQLMLLSRHGTWRSPQRLCISVSNVDDDYVLDADQAQILEAILPTTAFCDSVDREGVEGELDTSDAGRNLDARRRATKKLLREYFRHWEYTGLAPQAIGGFLALLGDREEIQSLTTHYLAPFSTGFVRDRLGWDGKNGDAHNVIGRQIVVARIHEGGVVEVPCILDGSTFAAPLREEADSILTGTPSPSFPIELRLRRIATEKLSPDRLSTLLKVSAELVLRHAYNQKNPQLDALWDDLNKGAVQLDINLAHRILLKSAPFYLKQLGVAHQSEILRRVLRTWDDASRLQTEAEHYRRPADRARQLSDRALDELEKLLTEDSDAHSVVLEAVRKKLRDYQYVFGSIPFELFQNADDAVGEYVEMLAFSGVESDAGAGMPANAETFFIELHGNRLLFAHCGRPINYYRAGDFPGRERGFDQDLEKMLVLMSSDKYDSEKVTGKFGLGFKSCLLACDRPAVVSGRLAFEVIGGFIPQRLKTEVVEEIRRPFAASRTALWGETIVALDMTPTISTTPEAILSDFERWVAILLVFSRHIHDCAIQREGQDKAVYAWNPRAVGTLKHVVVGPAVFKEGAAREHAELVCFQLASGRVLLRVGPKGFMALPADCPSVWVTAPLQERCDFGFAVNAQFDIDPGRASLAKASGENIRIAHALGVQLGDAMHELWCLTLADWRGVAESLRLSGDVSLYEFWESVWDLFSRAALAKDNEPVRALGACIACGEGGLGRLARLDGPVPSGLSGDHKVLCNLTSIQYVSSGALGDPEVFAAVSSWPNVAQQVMPGHIVASSSGTRLRAVLAGEKVGVLRPGDRLARFELTAALLLEIGADRYVSPELASLFGRTVTRALVEAISLVDSNEHKRLSELLSTLRFLNRSDGRQLARTLLIENCADPERRDEGLRALFAPSGRALAPAYDASGQEFFLACRGRFEAPVEQMLEWVLAADLDWSQRAALRYLVEGELGPQLARALRPSVSGSWLHDVSKRTLDHPLLEGWSSAERGDLAWLISPSASSASSITTLPMPDATSALRTMVEWWADDGPSLIVDYEQRIYPGRAFAGVSADFDENNVENRAAWLTLFMVGAQHRIGRVTPEQSRAFLELCESRGWWAIFSSPAPRDNAGEWMRVLGQFIDDQVDSSPFDWWMRDFVSIYRLASYLKEYVEVFLRIDRMRSEPILRLITNPRIDATLQGGGLDAPPIEKTLGFGVCFVIRELRRSGIVTNAAVDQHCYAPGEGVRKLMSVLGCPHFLNWRAPGSPEHSRAIFSFLSGVLGEEDARFGGAFDIPLRLIAESAELQHHFLGAPLSVWCQD